MKAAIEGTQEVAMPVTFGALTTVVAFIPLMFFEGNWGNYAKQVPPIVAPVLLFSLIESKLILPSHLKHLRRKPLKNSFARIQMMIAGGLDSFIRGVYQPLLTVAVHYRASVVAAFISGGLLMAGYCMSGRMKFIEFPQVDTQRISCDLDMPDNTTLETTQQYMDRIQAAVHQLQEEYIDPGNKEPIVQNISKLVGASRLHRDFDKSRGAIPLRSSSTITAHRAWTEEQ